MTQPIRDLIEAAVVIAIALMASYIARRVLTRCARRFDRTEKDMFDDLLRSLRPQVTMLIQLAGVYFALAQVQALQGFLKNNYHLFRVVAAVIVLTGMTNAINLAVSWYSRRLTEEVELPSHLSLLKKVAVLALWTLGSIQILTMLGVKVTAVLASLGIAGLAVGLALQDTLANFFAGFYLMVDRSVRAGDYIKLDSGEEGYVETVGWRNTRIRLWANNVVLVPNAKLIQSIITNMNLPNPVLSVYTSGGVSYDSDLDYVEKVAVEVARETLNNYPGGDMSYDPVLRFKEFGDSNVNFLVIFRAVDVGAQYLLQHEFIKALHRRFKEEGIEISYPVRKLVMDGATASKMLATRMNNMSTMD